MITAIPVKCYDGTPDYSIRVNPNWRDIEPGDPVVSDYILRNRTLAFIPFLFDPRPNEPDRTKCPLGGSLAADLCWPYGVLTDRLYEDYKPRTP